MRKYLKNLFFPLDTHPAEKIIIILLAIIAAFLVFDKLHAQETTQAPNLIPPTLVKIVSKPTTELTAPNGEIVPVDLKLLDLPGATPDDKLDQVTVKAYYRYFEENGQKIGQLTFAGVTNDNGDQAALDAGAFYAQLPVSDNKLTTSSPLSIDGDNQKLLEAIRSLTKKPAVTPQVAPQQQAQAVQSGSGSGAAPANSEAAGYKSPEALKVPTVTISETTEGCTVRIDKAQAAAIQQSRQITYEDGAVKDGGTCSDTLDRYPIQKSYSVCKDTVDLAGKVANPQYMEFYVDRGGSRNDIGECTMDSEKVFQIQDDASICTISLDFNAEKATPQASQYYNNINGVRTQVAGCSPITDKAVPLKKSADGCTMRHDFTAKKSYQQESYKYTLDQTTYQALPCQDSETAVYSHVTTYKDSAGNNICNPVINDQAKTVAFQSRIQITVNGLTQSITDCTPDTTTTSVVSTTDGCTDMSKWLHDTKAGVSYGMERYYYLDASQRKYINECQNSTKTYLHDEVLSGWQNHDDKLAAYPLSTISISSEFGKYTLLNSGVKDGAILVNYADNGTTEVKNGLTEYADGSCDVNRLTDKVNAYKRPDATIYNKVIGQGKSISEYACTATSQPVWKWTGNTSAGKRFSTSKTLFCGDGIYGASLQYTVYSLFGEYSGTLLKTREDKAVIKTISKNKNFPSSINETAFSKNNYIAFYDNYGQPWRAHNDHYMIYTSGVIQADWFVAPSCQDYPNYISEGPIQASVIYKPPSIPSNFTYVFNAVPDYNGLDFSTWNAAEGW